MRFICDQCGTKYSIADEKVRNKILKIRCKNCSHIIVVREQPVVAEQAPANAGAASSKRALAGTAPSTLSAGSPFSSKAPNSATASAEKPQPEAAERTVIARFSMDSLKRIQQGEQEAPTWFMALDGSPVGPVVRSEVVEALRDGRLDPGSLVWHAGWPEWVPAESVDELQDAFSPPQAPASLLEEDEDIEEDFAALDQPSEPALPAAFASAPTGEVETPQSQPEYLKRTQAGDSQPSHNTSSGFELGGLEDSHDGQLDLDLGLDLGEIDLGPVGGTSSEESALASTAVGVEVSSFSGGGEENPVSPLPVGENLGAALDPGEVTAITPPEETKEVGAEELLPASETPSFLHSKPSVTGFPEATSVEHSRRDVSSLLSTSVEAPKPFAPAPSPFEDKAAGSGGDSLLETDASERTALASSSELLSNFALRSTTATSDEAAENAQVTSPLSGMSSLLETKPAVETFEETGGFPGLAETKAELADSDEEALFFAHADGSSVPVTIAHTSRGDEAVLAMELPPLPSGGSEVDIAEADILEVEEELREIKKKSSSLVPILAFLFIGCLVFAGVKFGLPLLQEKQSTQSDQVAAKTASPANVEPRTNPTRKVPPRDPAKKTIEPSPPARRLPDADGVKAKKTPARKRPALARKKKARRRVVRKRRTRPRKRPVKVAMLKAKPANNDAMALALAQMAQMDKGKIKRRRQKKIDLSGVKIPKGVSRSLIRSMYQEVNRHLRQVKYCYELHLKNATFSGQLLMDLEVKPSGRVGKVKALTRKFRRKKVTRCIQRSMKRWKFPSFSSSKSLRLQVPFDLKPVF